MIEPKNKNWGPWISWGLHSVPKSLGDTRFQAIYINGNGVVRNDALENSDRHQDHHAWGRMYGDDLNSVTLAYRMEETLEQPVEPQVLTQIQCPIPETPEDENMVLIRQSDGWKVYNGSTSLRKLYYAAWEMHKLRKKYCGVYGWDNITAVIFPKHFQQFLPCTSIDGVRARDLPERIFARPKKTCKVVKLGNGLGSICTFCGKKDK
jgi:hypothetical protein